MSSHIKLVVLIFALGISHPVVAADISQLQIKESGEQRSTTAENALSETDLDSARSWNLSAVEWRRYQQLIKGIRGSVSPETISPIEVLGIHARDTAERQRYAEAWARAMREDVERILAFQQAYDAAGKRLYPNEPLIDISRLPEKLTETGALQSADRLLFFTRPKCPACDLLIGKLLQRIDDVSGIDIYLVGLAPGDDAAVRDWASRHQIKPQWVRSRRITLNHEAGALERVTSGQGEVPYLVRRRGEHLSQLRASDL